MQLVEFSEVGVRSALVTLTNPHARLRWLLFPMVHLAPAAYYARVEERMRDCHFVIAQGLDAGIVDAFAAAYRPGPMTAAEAERGWEGVPLALRAGAPLLAPLYGLVTRCFADLGQAAPPEVDDLPPRGGLEAETAFAAFAGLLGRREETLLAQLDACQRDHAGEDWTVGLACAAKRMPPAINHLTDRLGYRPAEAAWITVFDRGGAG